MSFTPADWAKANAYQYRPTPYADALGGEFQLESGRYLCERSWLPRPNTVIRGRGGSTVLEIVPGGWDAYAESEQGYDTRNYGAITLWRTANVGIRDLTLRGALDTHWGRPFGYEASPLGIQVYESQDILIENVRFEHFPFGAVWGAGLYQSKNIRFVNCHFYDCSWWGPDSWQFKAGLSLGPALQFNATGCSAIGCTFERCGGGVAATGIDQQVVGNRFADTLSSCILVADNDDVKNVHIADNVMTIPITSAVYSPVIGVNLYESSNWPSRGISASNNRVHFKVQDAEAAKIQHIGVSTAVESDLNGNRVTYSVETEVKTAAFRGFWVTNSATDATQRIQGNTVEMFSDKGIEFGPGCYGFLCGTVNGRKLTILSRGNTVLGAPKGAAAWDYFQPGKAEVDAKMLPELPKEHLVVSSDGDYFDGGVCRVGLGRNDLVGRPMPRIDWDSWA